MILPEVSVVIPNYNHGQYLKKRIQSVLDQSFQNFEVIILDDCSTDNSQEVIREFSNLKIYTTIFNEVNSGSPFKQWQRGITLARGEWIWIAESDDYADKNFLEVMMHAVRNQEYAPIGMAYCDSKIVEGDSVLAETFAGRKNKTHHTNRWSLNYANHGSNELEDYVLPFGTINNTSAVLFNRKLLMEVDPFDLDLRYIGDKYTFVKILSRANLVYVSQPLNYYRDPFNTKHADRWIHYFHEHFLVLSWVYKSVKKIDRVKFFKSFYSNTRCSMVRGWSAEKRDIFRNIYSVNPGLALRCIVYNLVRPLIEILT